jgi:hypothetical protein
MLLARPFLPRLRKYPGWRSEYREGKKQVPRPAIRKITAPLGDGTPQRVTVLKPQEEHHGCEKGQLYKIKTINAPIG